MIYVILIVVGAIFMVWYENNKDREKTEKANDIDSILNQYMDENNISRSKVIGFSEERKLLGQKIKVYTRIAIDTNKKAIYIFDFNDYADYGDKYDILTTPRIVKFKDIIQCELVEDDATIQKGGVGRAVVGGALAGGVGAVVGATTRKSKNVVSKLDIRIICKDINNSMEVINVITEEIDKSDFNYEYLFEVANEIYSTIISIIDSNKNKKDNDDKKEVKTKKSNKDKLKELKSMYEEELITKEEYDKAKKDLLSKM